MYNEHGNCNEYPFKFSATDANYPGNNGHQGCYWGND